MSRQIKFRVWNTYQKKFYAQSKVAFTGDGTPLFFDWHEDSEMSWQHDCYNSPDNGLRVTQQSTGVFDQNDKEIYEGDIVRWDGPHESEWLGDVKYDAPSFMVCWKKSPYQTLPSVLDKHVVVVGNVFENQELLK
jgi:uncharacterized phage protein (TIGR01671 family)